MNRPKPRSRNSSTAAGLLARRCAEAAKARAKRIAIRRGMGALASYRETGRMAVLWGQLCEILKRCASLTSRARRGNSAGELETEPKPKRFGVAFREPL